MLGALILSGAFIVLDVLSVTHVLSGILPIGINPFWKLSFVFKCLTDSVVLDDFKTALDRLRAFKISRLGSFAIDADDIRNKDHHEEVRSANNWADPPTHTGRASPVADLPPMPSPDGDYINTRFEKSARRQSRRESVDHIENEKFAAVRTGSRDRDDEENAIALDDGSNESNRATSESHILKNQASWIDMGRTSDSTDLDEEYAQAVREMTSEDHAEARSKRIGVAR